MHRKNRLYQHSGGQVVIKPTKAQSGGFLGTLLIGVPLLLNALTGKGLQVDRKRPTRSLPLFVPKPVPTKTQKKDSGLVLLVDYRPPPFFGFWENPIGMGVKNKAPQKGKELLLGKNSPFSGIPILGAIL